MSHVRRASSSDENRTRRWNANRGASGDGPANLETEKIANMGIIIIIIAIIIVIWRQSYSRRSQPRLSRSDNGCGSYECRLVHDTHARHTFM